MTLHLRPKQAAPSGWLALSDKGILDDSPLAGMMHQGQFVAELAMPLTERLVLLDHQAFDGWARTFAVLFDPAIGFVIAHRQGARLVRHVLQGPLPQGTGDARLTFSFDAPAKRWSLRFEFLTGDAPAFIQSHGADPLPLQISDLAAICTSTSAHPALLWFGASQADHLPGSAPWVGLRTQIQTSRGPVAAGNLRAGDVLLTLDQGPQVLRSASPLTLPARGSFAPVLLRAPYFGEQDDMLVSADQLIAITGPENEYLFNTDSVLVAARALVDGRTAFCDNRRSVTGAIALDVGGPCLINASGCILALGNNPRRDLPLRALKPFETLTLMSMLGRSPRYAA